MIEFTSPLTLTEECPKHWMPYDRYHPCWGCVTKISRESILIERGILPIIAIQGVKNASIPHKKEY